MLKHNSVVLNMYNYSLTDFYTSVMHSLSLSLSFVISTLLSFSVCLFLLPLSLSFTVSLSYRAGYPCCDWYHSWSVSWSALHPALHVCQFPQWKNTVCSCLNSVRSTHLDWSTGYKWFTQNFKFCHDSSVWLNCVEQNIYLRMFLLLLSIQ